MNDSLPYIDETHEDYEEYALHLVEEEMKRLAPRKAEALAEVRFRSPFMEEEYKRVAAKEPAPELENDSFPKELSDNDSMEAWEEVVKQAKVAYEKERLRAVLLDISKEGLTAAEQWKQMNAYLENTKAQLEKSVQEQKARVEAINFQRQSAQQKTGQELYVLTTRYTELVEKTHQLKQAVSELQEELKQ